MGLGSFVDGETRRDRVSRGSLTEGIIGCQGRMDPEIVLEHTDALQKHGFRTDHLYYGAPWGFENRNFLGGDTG